MRQWLVTENKIIKREKINGKERFCSVDCHCIQNHAHVLDILQKSESPAFFTSNVV